MINYKFELSIIVIHLGSDELLINFLESLYAYPLSFEFETIVVDNFSNSNELSTITKKYVNCNIIHLNNRFGYSKATNFGINESKGKYILWCNNDLIFKENAINLLYNFLNKNSDYAIASPSLLNEDFSIQPCYSKYNLNIFTLLFPINGFNSKKVSESFDIKVAPGACCMISKSALKTIGGNLDENYYMYCEEFDLSYRFIKNHYKIRYIGHSEVIHLGGKTTNKTSVNFLIQSLKSKLYYLNKNFNRFQKIIFYIFLIIKFLGKGIYFLLLTPFYPENFNRFSLNKKIFLALIKFNLLNSNKLILYYHD
jgi:GT2 family glycosyltransferase